MPSCGRGQLSRRYKLDLRVRVHGEYNREHMTSASACLYLYKRSFTPLRRIREKHFYDRCLFARIQLRRLLWLSSLCA